jgi:hypothetical protein
MRDTPREWSALEIGAIADDRLRLALSPIHANLKLIADGAQASILSATILHGDAALGLKGAIPDLQQRMGTMETRQVGREALDDSRYAQNAERLEKLERGQHRIRRSALACVRFVAQKQGGNEGEEKRSTAWSRIALAFAALSWGWKWLKWAGMVTAHHAARVLYALVP